MTTTMPAGVEAGTSSTGSTAVWVLRAAVAALAGTMAGIHFQLYQGDGYRHIPSLDPHGLDIKIGQLFLLNGWLGAVIFIAVLAVPRRFVGWVAAGAALTFAGTFAGLLVSVHHGIFGFKDTLQAPMAHATLGVEGAGFVVSLVLIGVLARARAAAR